MIDISSSIGTLPEGGLHRLALTDEDKEIRDIYVQWLQEAGLQVRIDDFGNIYGRREGKIPDLPPVVVGSHLDTQPQGGRFDGIIGVLSALEVIHVLNHHGIKTERPIEIVNFTNEEGARFEPPMLGSGGMSASFTKDFVHNITDRNGKTFGEELRRIGYLGSKENRLKNGYRFVELHIEQGPILENEGTDIGVVSGIQGMEWFEIELTGQSDHAGPTPMTMRKDALITAAKMILGVEELTKKTDVRARSTVGRIKVDPDSINCVPGKVVFSLDLRHDDEEVRHTLIREVIDKLETIASGDDIQIKIKNLWKTPTTIFDRTVCDFIHEGAEKHGYSAKEMIAGAGHDAKYVHEMIPSAMIFVPSVDGKSHCQEELTHWGDIEKGANVMLYTVYKLSME